MNTSRSNRCMLLVFSSAPDSRRHEQLVVLARSASADCRRPAASASRAARRSTASSSAGNRAARRKVASALASSSCRSREVHVDDRLHRLLSGSGCSGRSSGAGRRRAASLVFEVITTVAVPRADRVRSRDWNSIRRVRAARSLGTHVGLVDLVESAAPTAPRTRSLPQHAADDVVARSCTRDSRGESRSRLTASLLVHPCCALVSTVTCQAKQRMPSPANPSASMVFLCPVGPLNQQRPLQRQRALTASSGRRWRRRVSVPSKRAEGRGHVRLPARGPGQYTEASRRGRCPACWTGARRSLESARFLPRSRLGTPARPAEHRQPLSGIAQ